MSLTGPPDGPPVKSGLSLVDLSAAYVSAVAVLAGLWRARRDGVGCDCDISLFETALAELMYVGTWTATKGYQPPRRPNSAHPSLVPFQNFATADGWIVIACPKEKFWRLLCEAIGRQDLADDERYADFAGRDRHRDALLAELEAALRVRATSDWLAVLGAAGVPCAPVNDVAEALADRQAVARGALVEVGHERFGSVRTIASPLRVGDETRAPERAPRRGEHTEAVLRELCGYDPGRIEQLAAAGVFGER
jgi:crotonobetainyl-CoA:carnitine CoA-transferase CaiB-like acyl-CoA transferase